MLSFVTIAEWRREMRRVACIFVSMLLVATVLAVPGINAEVGIITLDYPDPMVYEASQYLVEGSLPIGYSATINGEETEVFRKFRHTVELNKDPSYTAILLELLDESGNTVESGELQVENNYILDAWLQQNNLKWTVDGEELTFHALPQIVDSRWQYDDTIQIYCRGLFWSKCILDSRDSHRNHGIE